MTHLRIDEAVERLGDRSLYLEIAQAFVDALPGIRAAMDAARARADLAELRRLAHSLKSNCATLGAEEARQAAYALETACRDGNTAAVAHKAQTLDAQLDALHEALAALR